ncbi:cytochrome P450 [Actinomadura sp. NBRC 104412]|uniref:cytochrome P450 n=1 Tax=Actinomadura sp. NBRC 104412 TaxID=3032203 RepID=UPI0024A11F35|nr:cytochrome P450 [Actinomadura sp. NBRC 104412]GLZ03410.1 cytochrome P450 [Actinomadura sp. NBRC 104412]
MPSRPSPRPAPPARRFPYGAAVTVAELDRDPHPLLARLRAHEPVSWLPALECWLVTSHDLAVRVMRDAASFTVDDPRFSTARLLGPSMLSLDGREHTRHRDPFARAFRPAMTRERFTAFVEAEAARLVTALAPAGRAELRGDLAGPLAVAVVAEALGLDGVDAATVRSWYGEFVDGVSAITAGQEPPPGAAVAYDRLRAAVREVIGASPAGSPLASAAHRNPDRGEGTAKGGGLTEAEVVANAAVLMFGGIDTTEGMITNAVLHLLEDPGRLALVQADPGGLLAGAIEESLRLEPSASVVDRYATRDLDLGGAPVRKGDLVRVSIAGANRDPAVFADPDRFDPRRENVSEHLAFAHGPHFCFGAPLARLEAHAVLTALLTRLPGLRLDPSRQAPVRGLVFRKPPHLHVLWGTPPGTSDM